MGFCSLDHLFWKVLLRNILNKKIAQVFSLQNYSQISCRKKIFPSMNFLFHILLRCLYRFHFFSIHFSMIEFSQISKLSLVYYCIMNKFEFWQVNLEVRVKTKSAKFLLCKDRDNYLTVKAFQKLFTLKSLCRRFCDYFASQNLTF